MQEFRNLKPAILMFVDDSEADIDIVKRSFEAKRIQFIIEHYTTVDAALTRLEDNTQPLPDMIFIDRRLNGTELSGDDLITKIRVDGSRRYSSCRVIVLSGLELNEADKKNFTEMNVDVFFPKPLQISAIVGMIEQSQDYYFQIMRDLIRVAA